MSDEVVILKAKKSEDLEDYINQRMKQGWFLESFHMPVTNSSQPYNFVAVMIKFGSTE